MTSDFPVPPEILISGETDFTGMEDAALEIYQKVADLTRALEAATEQARKDVDEQASRTKKLIVRLAAERFEFERLFSRLSPELDRLQAAQLSRALDLFRRGWDQMLRSAGIEVLDLAGAVLSDELAESLEVEGAIPDPAVSETVIRETLSPLVRLEGRTIGIARVITSVPVNQEGLPQ